MMMTYEDWCVACDAAKATLRIHNPTLAASFVQRDRERRKPAAPAEHRVRFIVDAWRVPDGGLAYCEAAVDASIGDLHGGTVIAGSLAIDGADAERLAEAVDAGLVLHLKVVPP